MAEPYPEGGFGTDDWQGFEWREGDEAWVKLPLRHDPGNPSFGATFRFPEDLGPWPATKEIGRFLAELSQPQKDYLKPQCNLRRSAALR